jgi:hypothetical protein
MVAMFVFMKVSHRSTDLYSRERPGRRGRSVFSAADDVHGVVINDACL